MKECEFLSQEDISIYTRFPHGFNDDDMGPSQLGLYYGVNKTIMRQTTCTRKVDTDIQTEASNHVENMVKGLVINEN